MSTQQEILTGDEATPELEAPQTGDGTYLAPVSLTDATGNEVAFEINYITNKATSGDDTGVLIALTDTSSPGVSLPFDYQLGGVSTVSLDGVGQLRLDKAQTFGATTGLMFGDGNTGFFEDADNNLVMFGNGSDSWIMNNTNLDGADTGAPRLRNRNSTATTPNINPDKGDTDTGIGSAGLDQLSLIAGDIEGIRLTEVSDHVIQKHEIHAGLTASTDSGQGDGPLLSSYNEIATCANAGDAVTLPTAAAGIKITIMNNGAQACDVFPASGDNLGAGVDTASSLAAGSNITYMAYDATNWEVI